MSNDGYLDKAIGAADGVKNLAAGAQHVPFDYTVVPTEFLNGDHLDNPGGGATVTIDAKAGPNTNSTQGDIEIIHFGRVHLDAAAKFSHDAYNDTRNIDLADVVGGRGGMHRAALQRELLLQCGYLRALEWAMEEAGKTPPNNTAPDGLQMIDQLMGMVTDLFGGESAGQLKASTLDINPLIAQANAIGTRLNQANISYFHLHKAGVDLHDLRCKYRAFLESQHATTPTAPTPPAGLLGGLPLLGDALGNIPMVGDVLKWSDKIMGCSVQLVSRITLEMHLKMEPSINDAVHAMSLDAIRNRRPPVFKPWWNYGPPAPTPPGGGGSTPNNLLAPIINPVETALQDADDSIRRATNIFTIPDKSSPGDAFIDLAFMLNPAGSMLDRSEDMAAYGAAALCRAVDEDASFMPPIVEQVAGYIFRLVSEFVRAVFIKLLAVKDGTVTAAQLAEGGRTHLLNSLIDWPLSALNLDRYIDAPNQPLPSLTGGPPQMLSLRGLFTRLRDELIAQLGFMDAAVEFAMQSFSDLLNAAQGLTDPGSRAMEPYLALIPTLHATMFRNIFLPFWQCMRNAMKSALGAVLAPLMNELGAGGAMGTIFSAADTAGRVAARAKKAIELFGDHVGLDNYKEVGDLGRGLGSSNAQQAFNRGGGVAPLTPLPNRKASVAGTPVTDQQCDLVAPDLKWDPAAPVNEPAPGQSAAGAQPGAGASGATGATP